MPCCFWEGKGRGGGEGGTSSVVSFFELCNGEGTTGNT